MINIILRIIKSRLKIGQSFDQYQTCPPNTGCFKVIEFNFEFFIVSFI